MNIGLLLLRWTAQLIIVALPRSICILRQCIPSRQDIFLCQQPVSISYRFRDHTRGPKGQKCYFWNHMKFLIFIQFWLNFFHWIPLNKSFQNHSADYFYLLPFLRYKGSKRAKMRFLKPHQIFIFHPILMGFFSLDSSEWDLSELLQPIFYISYRFRDTRGPKGQKHDFWGHIQFWWDFFHWIPLNESFQNFLQPIFFYL